MQEKRFFDIKVAMRKDFDSIKRGTVEIISEEDLKKKLGRGKPLNIKFGADPTSSDLHLGHTVVLEKLKTFQDLGHNIIFIIGDYTARIGDPSGRSEIRKKMSEREVNDNAGTYQKQVFKILDRKKTKVVFNSQWFGKMAFSDLLELTAHSTVAQMLARADFKKRYTEGDDISILEFMYPLLQAYDSIKVKADVELGGTDQIFNLLMGREFQVDNGMEPQVVITMPLLEGLDGAKKMSKTYDNYIGISEPAREIFGKVMSVSDTLMVRYYELLTDKDLDKIKAMDPRDAKIKLAKEIVGRFQGKAAAEKSWAEFEKVFVKRGLPENIETVEVKEKKIWIVNLLILSGLANSKNDAKRIIQQGALRIDQEKVIDDKLDLVMDREYILQAGKRKFKRVKGI